MNLVQRQTIANPLSPQDGWDQQTPNLSGVNPNQLQELLRMLGMQQIQQQATPTMPDIFDSQYYVPQAPVR